MGLWLKRARLKCLLWASTCRLSFSFWHVLSRLLNFLWGLFLAKSEVQKFDSLEALNLFLKGLSWSEDRFEAMNLKISHNWMKDPRLLQTRLNDSKAVQTDCDEFALYAEAALLKMRAISIIEPRVLTVRALTNEGEIKGHNVAVFGYFPSSEVQIEAKRYGHIGNWGLFKGYESIPEVAREIAKQMKGRPIAYCITGELRMKEHRVFRDQVSQALREV